VAGVVVWLAILAGLSTLVALGVLARRGVARVRS
jgi:hypothetical protein